MTGSGDLISYGAPFLAHTGLPRRLAGVGPYNTPPRDSLYGDAEGGGYTDYPFLTETDIA